MPTNIEKPTKSRSKNSIKFFSLSLVILLSCFFCWFVTIKSIFSENVELISRGSHLISKKQHPIGYIFALLWDILLSTILTYTLFKKLKK